MSSTSDPGSPPPSDNFYFGKQAMPDGTPLVGNKLAWLRNDNNLSFGVSAPTGMQPIARCQVAINLFGSVRRGDAAGQTFLDYSALESCLNSSKGAPVYGQNVICLPNGGVCAIYKQRNTTADPWSFWYRVNNMGGYQASQPPIVPDVMGNWSARQAISVPTCDWLQVVHGQDMVVALYNTGKLQINQVQPDGYGPSDLSVYMPTIGDLKAIYALDAACTTWSDPITIASNVRPIMGGLCWTGGEWVVVYTRSADMVCVCKRSRSLKDWSASVEMDTGVFRPADPIPGTLQEPSPHYVADMGVIPQKRLHCYGLTYDDRNMIQGFWAPYDDTPQVYDTLHNVFGSYPQTIYYGGYMGVISPDQGRTWLLQHPYGRSGTGRQFAGGATMVDGQGYVMSVDSACHWSESAFTLDLGSFEYY